MRRLHFKLVLIFLIFFLLLQGAYFLSQNGSHRPWLDQLRDAGFFAGISLLLSLLFFTILRNRLLRPLGQIETHMTQFQTPLKEIDIKKSKQLWPEFTALMENLESAQDRYWEKLHEAKQTGDRLQALMRTAQVMVVGLDRNFQPLFINDYGSQKLQINISELSQFQFADLLGKDLFQSLQQELEEAPQIINHEASLMLQNGEKMDIDLSIAKILDNDNALQGYIAVVADITKRKKAEINLKNQIIYSQQIFQSIPEMIVITDRNLRITFINQRAKQMLKQPTFNPIGQYLISILSKKSSESGFDELLRNIISKGEGISQINVLNPFLDETHYVDLVIEPLRSGNACIGGILLLRDISEWRQLTAQLRALQGFMQRLINASPYAVISITTDSLITTWNQSAERILNTAFADAFGKNLYEILPIFQRYKDAIDDVMILKKTTHLSDEKVFIGEEDFIVANLTIYPVTGEQSGVVIHLEDVSEFRKLESTLLQAQKMESLGLFTSSIIHDFNNVLSGILGYASLLEKKIGSDTKLQKYVSTIITSSERASSLINQILNYSRKKLSEKEIINLNDVIKESLDFIILNLKNVHIETQFHPDKIMLSADRTKISQSVINLMMNARDAFANISDPRIQIKTDKIQVSGQRQLLDGQYALLEVSDNGCGIPKENLAKIFEPFFTTKGQGKGTGLGLAIVREIIKDYNGHIDVESEVGRGTTFRIYLPVFEKGEYPCPEGSQKRNPVAHRGFGAPHRRRGSHP